MAPESFSARTVAVTGANGFIGRRLCAALAGSPAMHVLPLTRQTLVAELRAAVERADTIVHLAGVTRPPSPEQFDLGNRLLTEQLAALVREAGTAPLILFASSVRATQDTDYGRTKRAAEEILLTLGVQTGARIVIFRLPQVFGRDARPHYNAISATLLADAAGNQATEIHRPSDALELVDVADVVRAISDTIADAPAASGFRDVTPMHHTTVGDVQAIAARFARGSEPDPGSALEIGLFDAFLGYRASV